MNVLFDVLAPVAESAGAYGDKDEYAALAQETRNLNQVRRTLADAVENMSAQRDAEFAALQRRATEEASAPPTKIIIDDNAPAPKKSTVRKKKTTPKK